MIRIFLDANILFSAAYTENNGILKLWRMKKIRLVTSHYALKEAEHNLALKRSVALKRLAQLTENIEISAAICPMDNAYGLPDKDLPILEAAIGSRCAALLTGDMDFAHLFEKTIKGTRIMPVRMFLAEWQ